MAAKFNAFNMMWGGNVERYHSFPGIAAQTNAAHQWGVVSLLFLICDHPSTTVLRYALFHDMAEQHVSDVSAPVKRSVPGLQQQLDALEKSCLLEAGYVNSDVLELTPYEETLLKLADVLEGFLYATYREVVHGEAMCRVVADWYAHYIEQLGSINTCAIEYRRVREIMKEARNPDIQRDLLDRVLGNSLREKL